MIDYSRMDVINAMNIARKQHQGQVDKVGDNYFNHPLRISYYISENCDPLKKWFLQCCSYLHDVAEDTDMTVDEIVTEMGLEGEKSQKLKEVLILLTHDKKDSYSEYITKLLPNEYARTVKKMDLKDNLNNMRFVDSKNRYYLKDKDLRRINKYIAALRLIKAYENNNPFEEYIDDINQFSKATS